MKELIRVLEVPQASVKPKITVYEICCEVCDQPQLFRGKRHVKCNHCQSPLNLDKLKPKHPQSGSPFYRQALIP
jgi:hypothetical protein